MIEFGAQDLANVSAPRRRLDAEQHRKSGVPVDQQFELRIEQMQRQTAIRRQMAPHARQRPALQIDRQEMLKRPEGHEDAAEAPIQSKLGHVLIHEREAPLRRHRQRRALAFRYRQHPVGDIDTGDVQAAPSGNAIRPVPQASSSTAPPVARARPS